MFFSRENDKRNRRKVNRMKNDITVTDRHAKPTVKSNYKKDVNAFLKKSSLFALNQIGNSRTVTWKVFWAIIFVTGIIGIVSQSSQFLMSYFRYPVIVNRESVNAKSQEFPAVTICNMNSIRKEFIHCLKNKLNYNECFAKNDEKYSEIDFSQNRKEPMCEAAIEMFGNASEKRAKFDHLLLSQTYRSQKKYGHQAKDLIKYCKFDKDACDITEFQHSLSSNYGNCYTFNSWKGKLYSKTAGPKSGLQLILDLEVDKYSPYTENVGARVRIHDPFEEPDIDESGVNISPGFQTYIALSKIEMVRLPAPYKDRCRNYEPETSQNLCKTSCLNNISFSSCACYVHQTVDSTTYPCDFTNTSVLCCVSNAITERNESCNCPLPCLDTVFNLQMSTAQWPSEAYYNSNPSKFVNGTELVPLEKVRETWLKVRIHFDTFDYTVFRQTPMYDSSEVLSQVGGQMGLWLGLSMVAIFEFLMNLITLCKRH